MEMNFTDGKQIDVSGGYRIIREADGLYVVGHDSLCPVNSTEEGLDLIRTLGGIAMTSQNE